MVDKYPHWGICESCGLKCDLNSELRCSTCQDALDTAKALMILDKIQFVQVLPVPKK